MHFVYNQFFQQLALEAIELNIFFYEENINLSINKGHSILSSTKNIDVLSKQTFYFNNFLVDPLKGVINVTGEVHQVELKVMQVLLFLAQDLGNVVEQEVLFSQVWPKSIYSPGSIRRCITVLRKIFKDENKALIVTHPKRGYSLQGNIHFPKKILDKKVNSRNKVLFIIAMTFLTSLGFALLNTGQRNINIHVVTASPVTASELHEDNASFSPDGRYIAFIRSIKSNEILNHIWLKNLENGHEHQLTKQAINAKSLVWMKKGKALLYVSVTKQKIAVNRITLDKQAQTITEIEVLNLPEFTWISSIALAEANELYYVAKHNGTYQLVKTNLTNGEQTILFIENNSFHPYSIALSKDSQQLAIFALNHQYNSTVKLLAINKLSTETINKTQEIYLGQNKYYGSWHPNNKSLVIHDGRDLFSLNLQGEMKKIAYENFNYIRYPEFSSDGKKILLTQQTIDEDIWLTPSDNTKLAIKLVDSNTADYLASLSPNGKKVAFVSIKRGFPQLFVHDIKSGKQTLVFDNPKQLLFIAYPVWNQTSTKIASALNQRPFIIELTHNIHTTKLLTDTKGIPLQWYFDEESLLMVNYDQGQKAYAKLSIANQLITTLLRSVEDHAQLNNNNELLLIGKTAVLKAKKNENKAISLVTINGQIINHYPTSLGIYLKVKQKEQLSLWFYQFSNNNVNKISELNGSLKIWDVETHNRFMLTSSHKAQKDLLLLTLEYSD